MNGLSLYMMVGTIALSVGILNIVLYLPYLLIFYLYEMDTYMCESEVAAHRRGPDKFSMLPFSGDVLMEYGGACGSKWLWKRRFSDLDRNAVPRRLRFRFAIFFYLMCVMGVCMVLLPIVENIDTRVD